MEEKAHVTGKNYTGEREHVVGRSVKRVDAFEKVTGRAKYTDDLCDKMRTWQRYCTQPSPTDM